MWDVIKQIISPAVVTVVVTALIAMAQSIRKDKMKNRHIDHRDAETRLGAAETNLDAFRAVAETHILEYDVPMRERVMQHEALINQLMLGQGKQPAVFPPLPKATPLFPKTKD
jgi:hypothetical protein